MALLESGQVLLWEAVRCCARGGDGDGDFQAPAGSLLSCLCRSARCAPLVLSAAQAGGGGEMGFTYVRGPGLVDFEWSHCCSLWAV